MEGGNDLRDATALPGPLSDLFGMTYMARVQSDLHGVTADALVADLSAALSGYRRQDFWRLTHRPIVGLDRLLLVKCSGTTSSARPPATGSSAPSPWEFHRGTPGRAAATRIAKRALWAHGAQNETASRMLSVGSDAERSSARERTCAP